MVSFGKMGCKSMNECQNVGISRALRFLERYQKDGCRFLSHIVRLTGEEIQGPVVNVEIEQQSKQWMHIHPRKKPKRIQNVV